MNKYELTLSISKISNNEFGYACLIKKNDLKIESFTKVLKNQTNNRTIMIGLIDSIKYLKNKTKNDLEITFHCNSLILTMPFKNGRCIKLVKKDTKNKDLWYDLIKLSKEVKIYACFEKMSDYPSQEIIETKKQLRKVKYTYSKKTPSKPLKQVNFNDYKDHLKLKDDLIKKSFIRKEGDTYHQIKQGEMYNVLDFISKDKGYGFSQKIAKSVIKYKKISEKQADIISKSIISYNKNKK